MFQLNRNYQNLEDPYVFIGVANRVAAYQKEHPEVQLIRFGVGDVTRPLSKTVVAALKQASEEMGEEATFHGYTTPQGYEFLREKIAACDFKSRGCDISADEIFVSDGAKSDCSNIQEIFSSDNRIGLCDPGYPVYLDSLIMAGKAGKKDPETGRFSNVIYLPCTEENGFVPELPKEAPDLIYLCSPCNPTGMALKKDELQKWVDFANRNHAIILFDAAYEAFITEPDVPHSIYECDGARSCAIEIRSFSKNAGFTGVRLGYTVVPKDIRMADGLTAHSLWRRRISTKFNGASYIQQRAGEAVYSEEGQKEIKGLVSYYQENAQMIIEGVRKAGYTVYGGVNAPYLWLKSKNGETSWEFFDRLLYDAKIVTTPGSGFGPMGEHFLRVTAFGSHENTKEAIRRLQSLG